MPATYTPGSGAALDRVRLLIPDKDLTGLTPVSGVYTLTTYQYIDAEIADFLTLEGDDVYGAAALALESAVSAAAQSGGKISGFGFSVENGSADDARLKRAAWLRGQSSAGGALSFVPVTYGGSTNYDEFARPPSYPFEED